jgi:hypothetical protein
VLHPARTTHQSGPPVQSCRTHNHTSCAALPFRPPRPLLSQSKHSTLRLLQQDLHLQMSRSQAMPITGRRSFAYSSAYSGSGSYSGSSYAPSTDTSTSVDYYSREECPATPHNYSSELIELNQQDSSFESFHPIDGTQDQLNELKAYGIDPNGYGSNINRIQDMWRPHSL